MVQETLKIDENVKGLIANEDLPEEVEKKAIARWFEFADEYSKSVDADERKKKASTITAHKKDETFYRNHQVQRIKKKTENYTMTKMDP